jgi:hypothetical protein
MILRSLNVSVFFTQDAEAYPGVDLLKKKKSTQTKPLLIRLKNKV